MHLIHRTTCRVCKSSALTKVIDLGRAASAGLVRQARQGSSADAADPDARWCAAIRCATRRPAACCRWSTRFRPRCCTRSYWYRSGTNDTMRDHLRGIARGGDRAARQAEGARARHRLQRRHAAAALSERRSRSSASIPSDVAQEVPERHHGRCSDLFPVRASCTPRSAASSATSSPRSRCSTTSRIRSASRARSSDCLAPEGIWMLRDVVHADDAAR